MLDPNFISITVNTNSGDFVYQKEKLSKLFTTNGGNTSHCLVDTFTIEDNTNSKIKLVDTKIASVKNDGSMIIDTKDLPATNNTYILAVNVVGTVSKDNGNSAT